MNLFADYFRGFMPFYTIQEINTNVTMDTAEKGTIPKQPLERSASSPKISYQPSVTIPTKKLRMRSLLWIKPPSGHAVSTTSSFLAQVTIKFCQEQFGDKNKCIKIFH